VFSIFQTDGVLRVLAQTRFLVVMNLARLTTIVLLMSWALHKFNLLGPVLVTIAGVMTARTVALMRIKKLLNVPTARLMPWMNIGGIAILAMLSAIPSALISGYVNLPPIYVLPISGTVYMAVYTSLLFVFRVLSEGERRAITELV